VRRAPHEKIVEREEPLAVEKIGLGQCHIAHAGLLVENPRDGAARLGQPERQQHTVEPLGIRIDCDNRDIAHVLGRVGNQSILAHDDHDHEPPEIESRQKTAIDELQRNVEIQFTSKARERILVDFVLQVEIFELFLGGAVCGGLVDSSGAGHFSDDGLGQCEFCGRFRGPARQQPLQPRLAGDDDNAGADFYHGAAYLSGTRRGRTDTRGASPAAKHYGVFDRSSSFRFAARRAQQCIEQFRGNVEFADLLGILGKLLEGEADHQFRIHR
jgi:hypothetical protein